jgi:hypothetical protein
VADSSLEESGFELVVPSLFRSWPGGPREYRLETLSALALNDRAYNKLTGWSNVIPVVPAKGDATET